MTSPKTPENQPPRDLRGRRARRLWRELHPIASESGALHAVSATLLQKLCVLLASIDPGRPEDDELSDWLSHRRPATAADITEILALARILKLLPK